MGEDKKKNVADFSEEEYKKYIFDMISKMDKTRLRFYYRLISGMEKERD